MLYKKQRALYYHFLMQEIGEVAGGSWKFVADYFGLSPEEVNEYEKALSNSVLAELSTICDVDIYRNYLHGFLCEEDEFGKSKIEQEVIEAKALALHKMLSLFGENSIKSNRLRALSHNYENDHIAAVLYALQILYLNDGSESESFAEKILMRELNECNNSDAGLVLLRLKRDKAEEIMTCLSGTPDMLLRPDVLKELIKEYGKGADTGFKSKRPIGF